MTQDTFYDQSTTTVSTISTRSKNKTKQIEVEYRLKRSIYGSDEAEQPTIINTTTATTNTTGGMKLFGLKDFNELQYDAFLELQILTFGYDCPNDEYLIRFLENNGKNLKDERELLDFIVEFHLKRFMSYQLILEFTIGFRTVKN
ncbi:5554_t:CDS:2 [Funneliformis caledonium]|uniref:5554_t:CDS:1 n=1 Tax=Funneliformis caledonium TaxID=1117310 RepID=A0A9N8ZW79_9GLOM|nr:5554_t:CDS:2 [Funneliformis caledonium]